MARFAPRAEHSLLIGVLPVVRPGRAGQDSRVEHLRPPARRRLRRQRHHHVALSPLAAAHRPPGPGQQVDPKHGERLHAVRHQAQPERLCAAARERDTVRHPRPAGERGRDAGLAPGAAAAQAGVQERRPARDQHRRQRGGVLSRVQVLHHDQAAQPPLHARDQHQDRAHQLHHHAVRPRGPAARYHSRARAQRARGGATAPRHTERRV
mmetsp:Transcript_10877/g.24709  ORF Transcript_10877/g.24709 Transcript_10877/m.24709 type:complete len:209 (+) Transcript_10877:2224-2850(+)